MADVLAETRRFRRRLLARDRQTSAAMLEAYVGIRSRLQEEVRTVERLLKEAAERGEPPAGFLAREERARRMLEQTDREVRRYARRVERTVLDRMSEAVRSAQQAVAGMLGAQIPTGVEWSLARLPADALEAIVATTRGQVGQLLDQIAPDTADRLRRLLVEGVGTGRNPNAIAADMLKAVEMPAWRATTIARTEVLRAYRTATTDVFRQNSDVMAGWVWWAELDERTCPVCIAMHGRQFPAGADFGSHPRCRCTQVPQTRDWTDLGFVDVPETAVDVTEDGAAWFARQPAARQRQVLGPGKYDLYRSGQLQLADLVGFRQHPRWGPTRHEVPLYQLRRQAAA